MALDKRTDKKIEKLFDTLDEAVALLSQIVDEVHDQLDREVK